MQDIIKRTYLGGYFELGRLPHHSSDVFFRGESISDRFSSVWALCLSISRGQSQRRLKRIPRKSMKINENQWKSMKINVFVCEKFQNVTTFPWKTLRKKVAHAMSMQNHHTNRLHIVRTHENQQKHDLWRSLCAQTGLVSYIHISMIFARSKKNVPIW